MNPLPEPSEDVAGRHCIASVPAPFVHGGPDAQGTARHDFSTNGNAFGPCPDALHALRTADPTRYPDPHYTALRDELAELHAVTADRIFMAASASEFIFRITGAVKKQGGDTVDVPAHAYGDYERAAVAWGMTIATEPGARSAALAWRCDPSSPLGQPVSGLGDFIDGLAPTTCCVLDLAYEPVRLEGCLGLDGARLDRVWQLWTPNKALCLTGVRAAYAIAPRQECEMSAVLQSLAPSWPVGADGVALLRCWTQAPTKLWLSESLSMLRRWKQRQIAVCEELGWLVRPSVANFFCVDPRIESLDALSAFLRGHGIKVRDTASFGLYGQWRLAVLPPESQDALRDAVIAARTFPGPAADRAFRCPPFS